MTNVVNFETTIETSPIYPYLMEVKMDLKEYHKYSIEYVYEAIEWLLTISNLPSKSKILANVEEIWDWSECTEDQLWEMWEKVTLEGPVTDPLMTAKRLNQIRYSVELVLEETYGRTIYKDPVDPHIVMEQRPDPEYGSDTYSHSQEAS